MDCVEELMHLESVHVVLWSQLANAFYRTGSQLRYCAWGMWDYAGSPFAWRPGKVRTA